MNNLVCTVCHCQLNGHGPLHQHLASASHIKKVEFKKGVLSGQTPELFCSTCNIICTSLSCLTQHTASSAHLDTVKKATDFEKLLNLNISEPLNALGLGDGIQMLRPQKLTEDTFTENRSQDIPDHKQNINTLPQIDLSTMNNFSIIPQRGPNGEAYVMRGDRGFCFICNLELTSLQHCNQHIQGNKHIKKEREGTHHLINLAPGNMYPASSTPLTSQKESNVRIFNNRGPNGEEYNVVGPGGRCFVCGVDFTSVELAQQHLAGQKHKKKAASQSLFGTPECNALGITSSGQAAGHIATSVANTGQQIDGHIAGNMAISGQVNVGNSGQLIGSVLSNVSKSAETSGFITSNVTNSDYIPSRNIGPYKPPPPSTGPNIEPYIMKDNRGYCYVCNLELTSPTHAQSHLSGKKHKKKCWDGMVNCPPVNRVDASLLSEATGVLMCSICKVPFSAIENANQHFRSEKHKNKERLLKSETQETSQPTQMEPKQFYQPSVISLPKEVQYALDPEQTMVMKVYQAPVQVHNDSNLNDVVTDLCTKNDSKVLSQSESAGNLNSHEASFHAFSNVARPEYSNEGIQLPSPLFSDMLSSLTDNCGHSGDLSSEYSNKRIQLSSPMCNMSSSLIENSELECNDSNRERSHMSSASAGNNLLETHATHVLNNDTVSDSAIKSETENCQSTAPDVSSVNTGSLSNDNLSGPLNQLSKVGNKEIEKHYIVQGTFNSLTDNSKLPFEESNANSTKKVQANGEVNSILCLHSEKHPSEANSGSPVSEEQEFQQQQNPLHHHYDTIQTGSNSVDVHVDLGQPFILLDNISSQVQKPTDSSGIDESLTAQTLAPFYFDGNIGQCYCCSVKLTSLKHANQHLFGQKHKKKMSQWELTQKLQIGDALQTTPYQPPTETPNPLGKVSAADGSYYFNGSRGFCHVCNIELSSVQHTQQHLNGKPHRRSYDRFCLSQKGVTYPLNCQICRKYFTGQESARQHFTSNKHKSKAEVLNESNQVLQVMDDGRVILKDGQVWYFCDVCKVPLNTREQFSIHKESPRHIKECENNRSRSSSIAEDLVVVKTILPDSVYEDLKSFKYHKGSSTFPEEGSQNDVDLFAISMEANNLQLDFEAQQNRHETDMQHQNGHETDRQHQNGHETDRQHQNGHETERQHQNGHETDRQHQNGHETDRQQVLDQNRQYLTYGQAPVVRQNSSIAANSDVLLHKAPFKYDGASAALVTGSQPHINSRGYYNVDSQAQVLGHLVGTSPTPRLGSTSRNGENPSSSEYFSTQSHVSHSPGSSQNSQMYKEVWQSLQAGTGQNAGIEWQTTSHRNSGSRGGGASTASENTKTGNAANGHGNISDPSSGQDSQGITHNTQDDGMAGGDGFNAEQNYLNSVSNNESLSESGNPGNMISKPRPSGQSKSRGNEKGISVLSFDRKEDDTFDDDDDEKEDRDHFNIVQDVLIPKLAGLELEPSSKPMRSDKPGFRYYCQVCNKHMNTKESYDNHVKGKNHFYMLSNSPAPVRQLPLIRKTSIEDIAERVNEMINKSLNITPRSYQIELVEKAVKGDCIIYLPTGTGKTLVAVLTMGLMLQENPSRPVLFLVDKVLLVMQQAQYIMIHFAGILFKRTDDKGQSVKRELKVKPICGGLTTKTDLPTWKHDIVVTTAAYCYNMLENGQIRWEDFSLVVLDEVHHCNKGHPYLRLMSKYHSVLPEAFRAKVLGLTASPAGKSTVEQTYSMLKSLLKNLGGAAVAVVEEQQECLKIFQSPAKVFAINVPMSSKEVDFKRHLLEYFILCYSQLALMTRSLENNQPPCSYFMLALQNPGNKEIATQLANQFIKDPEPLAEVLDVIYSATCLDESNVECRNRFDNLRLHICSLLLVIPEIGSGANINELLKALSPSPATEEFKKMGLPCQQIYQWVKNFADDGNNDLTMFNKLVETLQNIDVIDWSDTSSRALVLVRERKLAKNYSHRLRAHSMVMDKQLRVSHIVGHGKGAKDGGMDVKKQRRVFDNHEKYHILVATSIMEEGIDIKALQLVVCMNPPSSLRALVQMRGRARKENSHFVVLCSSEEDVDKLKKLQKQERHMQEAAKLCLEESYRRV